MLRGRWSSECESRSSVVSGKFVAQIQGVIRSEAKDLCTCFSRRKAAPWLRSDDNLRMTSNQQTLVDWYVVAVANERSTLAWIITARSGPGTSEVGCGRGVSLDWMRTRESFPVSFRQDSSLRYRCFATRAQNFYLFVFFLKSSDNYLDLVLKCAKLPEVGAVNPRSPCGSAPGSSSSTITIVNKTSRRKLL